MDAGACMLSFVVVITSDPCSGDEMFDASNASTEREKWSRESSGVVGAVAATEDIMLRGNSMVNIPSWVHFYQCKR